MDQVCAEVGECTDHYGCVRSQDSCGISIANALEILNLYLRSIFIKHNGQFFIQKDGVCIGSCLAPILSDVYYSEL